jgi:hypothetical protein
VSIKDTITEIQGVIASVTGVRQAPAFPPENLNTLASSGGDVFVVAYPSTGTVEHQFGALTYLHNIFIEVHTSRKTLQQDTERVYDYLESIVNDICDALDQNTLTTLSTFGDLAYEFGALGWGNVDTIGYRITMQDVKIRCTIDPTAASFDSMLEAYWKMEETGTGSRADATGNGHTLTNANASGVDETTSGIIGNAAEYTLGGGNQPLLKVTAITPVSPTNKDFTVSAWVRLGTQQDSAAQVQLFGDTDPSDAGVVGDYGLYITRNLTDRNDPYSELTTRSNFIGVGGSASFVTSSTRFIDWLQWTHIVMVVDRTNGIARLYKNGAQFATADISAISGESLGGNDSFGFGGVDQGGTAYWAGYVDEGAYWVSRALTASEVLTIYNNGAALRPASVA